MGAVGRRWGVGATLVILSAWVLLLLGLTLVPFSRHLDYFSRHGSFYRLAIIFVLVSLAVFSCLYAWLRRRQVWRWELRILVGAVVGIALAHSPLAVFVCLWIAAVSYAIGRWVLRRLSLESPPLAELSLSIGVGLGAFILILIPIGLVGLYSRVTFLAVMLAPTLIFWRELLDLRLLLVAIDRKWTTCDELRSPLIGVGIAFAPAFALAFLMATLAPSIAYDAMSHHLPAARHYLLGGTLEPLPLLEGAFDGKFLFFMGHSVAYSYYPQSFEELLTLAMGLGEQPAAQLITPLFFALTVLMAAAIAGLCRCSPPAIVVGIIACISLPFANWVGAIVKNDYALAFFILAALYSVLRALDGGRGWLLLSAYFLGLSFGVKHVALFGAIPIGLLVLNCLRRQTRRWHLALALAAVFAVSGLFWHARTFALTGNAFYPAGAETAGKSLASVSGSRPSLWTRHVLYPWIAHFDGGEVLESPSANPLGFFLLFFSICWVLTRRRDYSTTDWSILLFVCLYYLYWVYIWGVLRYAIAPIFLVTMMLAARVYVVATVLSNTR